MEFLAELQARALAAEGEGAPLSDDDSESSQGEGMVDREFSLSEPPTLKRASFHRRRVNSRDR